MKTITSLRIAICVLIIGSNILGAPFRFKYNDKKVVTQQKKYNCGPKKCQQCGIDIKSPKKKKYVPEKELLIKEQNKEYEELYESIVPSSH